MKPTMHTVMMTLYIEDNPCLCEVTYNYLPPYKGWGQLCPAGQAGIELIRVSYKGVEINMAKGFCDWLEDRLLENHYDQTF